jgi:hypothetical protein
MQRLSHTAATSYMIEFQLTGNSAMQVEPVQENQLIKTRPLQDLMSAQLAVPDLLGGQSRGPAARQPPLNSRGGPEEGEEEEEDDYEPQAPADLPQDEEDMTSSEEDLLQFLHSLSPAELAAYRNLSASGLGSRIPAAYHQTKSADFQSFETVANPDADITVRKVSTLYFFVSLFIIVQHGKTAVKNPPPPKKIFFSFLLSNYIYTIFIAIAFISLYRCRYPFISNCVPCLSHLTFFNLSFFNFSPNSFGCGRRMQLPIRLHHI